MESNEFNWSLFDFLVAGAIILFTVLMIILIVRKVQKRFRLLALAALVIVMSLIWVELAVGIFGTPFAGS